jgi:prepilin-type N-terminal cleavage/methylation domain-containing protein
MNKRFGFTLAEVLITLGIIGVVAAMTIPTLIANTNGAKYRSQFKKTVSTLNQAALMAQAQYDFDYAGTETTCSATTATAKGEHPEVTMTFCAILNGTLTGQTYYGKDKIKRNSNGSETNYDFTSTSLKVLNGKTPDNFYKYTLADGAMIGFATDAKGCELPIGTPMTGSWITSNQKCLGFIDVNGAGLPNKEVHCTTDANTANTVETPCGVKNDANHMTDIFPVVFHDATVEPASNAAKFVLTTAK